MADDTPTAIRSWHAHVYFDGAAQREQAARLRERIAERFTVQLGHWRDAEIGPHTRPMYMVAFAPELFASFVPWLALNRLGLDVLVHPNTLQPRADHLSHALWLGQVLPVKEQTLPEHIAASEDEPLELNNFPADKDAR